MADKTTGELTYFQESAIGDLPGIANLYDDTLLPVEQQGEARKMTGRQWKEYARAAVSTDVGAAESSAVSAANSAAAAAGSAGQALQHAQAANTARSGAESARDGAREAKQAIEDLTVSAVTLPPGSEATAVKTPPGGPFNIQFGIPRGEQGATGAAGAQGIQGPPGRDGINGVAVPTDRQWAFNVDENGHLLCSYTGNEAPDLSINEDGHLILNIT